MAQTYLPQFNVYADKNGVVSHDNKEGNTLVILANAPVSAEKADELKLRELDVLSAAETVAPAFELKAPQLTKADEKTIAETEAKTKADAKAEIVTTAPVAQGSK